MNLLYTGKTKDVYELPDGNYQLRLKDDATGKDGVFDPGENSVGLSIDGLGLKSLMLSEYYFKLIEASGIQTHFISCCYEDVSMTVKPAIKFGKGLEMICRMKAVGSFFKRYGDYIDFEAPLDSVFEITLKNDERNDPPITKEVLAALNIMSPEDYEYCRELTVKAASVIGGDLRQKGLEIYDIKFEFGKSNGKIILIDEISAGNMRVYKDGAIVAPMELADLVCKAGR